MDHSGNARIADFGLAAVTRNLDSVLSASLQNGHTVRWAAPEAMETGAPSKAADMFAFAMVMVEARRGTALLNVEASLFSRARTGIHGRSSVQRRFISHGNVSHNTTQAPSTAGAPKFYRESVGIDATMLGS